MQILVATDFSTRSQRALRRAGLLARERSAKLTLVHVVEDDQPRTLIELERREASKFLDEQIHSLDELRGVRCSFLLGSGAAFDGILQTARNLLGRSNRDGFSSSTVTPRRLCRNDR